MEWNEEHDGHLVSERLQLVRAASSALCVVLDKDFVIACPHMNIHPPVLPLSCQRLLIAHDARTDVNPGNSSVFLKGLALISLFAAALVAADDRLQARLSPCSITPSPHIYDTHPLQIAVNKTTTSECEATLPAMKTKKMSDI